ncbi:MAG: 4Fe-4S binding protein [Promethearchaeota archaeon]
MFGNSFQVPKFKFNKELCNSCGICKENCPTHVIIASELPKKQKGCIFCFNCVMVCPTNAIYSDLDKVKKVLKFNAKILHEESIREII